MCIHTYLKLTCVPARNQSSLSLPSRPPHAKKMWTSVAEHREGVEFFSDPIGKPSLFTYWRTLAEMSYSTLFLRSKRPTAEGFAAANNGPSSDWSDDGVTVRRHNNQQQQRSDTASGSSGM